MRRLRLAILGESPCPQCSACCCKQNGHDYAVLLRDEEVRRFAPFAIDAPMQQKGRIILEKVLPYRDGRCQFLGDDDRCLIYQDRPSACREFQCTPAYNQLGLGQHGLFLQRNPQVRHLLDSLTPGIEPT